MTRLERAVMLLCIMLPAASLAQDMGTPTTRSPSSMTAWAALPVAYNAEQKALKKNVFIDDPLAFEMYETPDCTGAPEAIEISPPGFFPLHLGAAQGLTHGVVHAVRNNQ